MGVAKIILKLENLNTGVNTRTIRFKDSGCLSKQMEINTLVNCQTVFVMGMESKDMLMEKYIRDNGKMGKKKSMNIRKNTSRKKKVKESRRTKFEEKIKKRMIKNHPNKI